MKQIYLEAIFYALMIFCCIPGAMSQEIEPGPVILSDSIGAEIDRTERDSYHLFPDIKAFQSARIVRKGESEYHLEYTSEADQPGPLRIASRSISAEAVELTKLHVRLVEDFRRLQTGGDGDQEKEAQFLYQLGLRYASEARYDIASTLFNDLLINYPESAAASQIKESRAKLERLWSTNKALFREGSLLDHSGRTDLLIFSGYYGLWLGVATPIALKAQSPQAFALGLLLGGPASVLLAHSVTRDANVSEGSASIISLGGHLGIWQGIGWASAANIDGEDVIGIGELGGLAGIGVAALLAHKVNFSEGHAALTSSGLHWGAWFGLVAGEAADIEDDDLLRMALIGSDVFILGAGVLGRGVEMSETRVRWINLGGLLGAVFGFGIDLLVEVDDASTAFLIAGAGSVAGLAITARATRDFDRKRDFSLLEGHHPAWTVRDGTGRKIWSLSPQFTLQRNPFNSRELIPAVALQFRF